MDATIKVTGLHVITGIIAGILSASLSLGWFGFKNEIFGFFLGVIIVYFTGKLAQKLVEDEISGFSQWLWDGIAPFFFTWIIVWVLAVCYL